MDKPTPPEPQPYWNIDDYKRVHAHKALLKHGEAMAAWGAAQERGRLMCGKLWLWRNFVNGRPEFWAFDNPFPIHLGDNGDPQTLGEPVGYALFKASRVGRTDVTEAEVLRRINAAQQGD